MHSEQREQNECVPVFSLAPLARHSLQEGLDRQPEKEPQPGNHQFHLEGRGRPPARPRRPAYPSRRLVPLIPATAYHPVTVEGKSYWAFTLAVRIPGLGKVRLVISFESAELTDTSAVFVTNRAEWSTHRIIATYLQRGPIETFDQDGEEHLGLDEHRVYDAEAIQKHQCLVFVARSLLHLNYLPLSLKHGRLLIKTIAEAYRQQAQALIEPLILHTHERLLYG